MYVCVYTYVSMHAPDTFTYYLVQQCELTIRMLCLSPLASLASALPLQPASDGTVCLLGSTLPNGRFCQ